MLRLVKAEIFKLFKNKTFRVLCGVAVFLAVMMTVMTSSLIENMMMDKLGDMPEENKQQVLQSMGAAESEEQVVTPGNMGLNLVAKDPMNPTAIEVYHSSFGAGLTEILIGVLIAAFLAKEYSEGTIKNTLAYGKKRREFYLAKFLALIVGISIIIAILSILPTIGANLVSGWGQEFELSQITGMIATFITAVIANSAVASIIMVIAIAVKSNGATIGITAGLFLLEPMFLSLEYGVYPTFDKIYELTPFYNTALATSVHATGGDLIRAIAVALITIVIFLLAGTRIFKAQDIK